MKFSFRFTQSIDLVLFVVALLLTSIGLAAQYSIDLSLSHAFADSFLRTQLIALGMSIILCIVLAYTHVHVYRTHAPLLYAGALLLLVAVLFFGTEIRGTRGWFRLAGFSFQPAELAKVAVTFILAWLVVRFGRSFDRPQFFLSSGIAAAVPVLLILLQPDLGSAIVLFSIWCAVVIFARVRRRYLIGTGLCLILAAIVGWFFLFAPYQKDRVLTFIDPARDPLGAGYNVTQSVIAIGSGQFLGRGLGFGSQSQLRFLPEAQTDFIFAVIAEELGFLGALVLLILFALLFWRLLVRLRACKSEFGAYVILGTLIVFFVQCVFNIGGATGLLPVTGVTLPFVSYGGSSLLINYALLGIVLSISRGEYAS